MAGGGYGGAYIWTEGPPIEWVGGQMTHCFPQWDDCLVWSFFVVCSFLAFEIGVEWGEERPLRVPRVEGVPPLNCSHAAHPHFLLVLVPALDSEHGIISRESVRCPHFLGN
eukprot:TRINITY_DN2815_c0_g1_i4.p1 TRINITY_DN2815_c0_g1~~TRINITY_DN2815_c0_g1_i4.p1  ORF type:complete len:111 (-),score=4.00 TRINITY_DN2815_c0_g1_i4:139-471(-)